MNKPNRLTKLFPIAVGAFGWQVHGLWVGIGVAILFVLVIILTNFIYMSKLYDKSADPIRGLQRIKLIMFIAFMIVIAISGAKIVELV